MEDKQNETLSNEWVTFPGGELEGKRPKTLCAACRERLMREALDTVAGANRPAAPSQTAARCASRFVCFQCYRADVARERGIKAAADLDTASETRFQTTLPFEP